MYVPSRFKNAELAYLGNDLYVVAIYMLATEDGSYAVSNVNAMVRIEPSSINTVMMGGREYLEFVFEPGDRIIATDEVVVNDKLVYYIYEEILSKGNVPVYLDYMELGRLFDTSQSYAKVKLASTPTVLHMLLSIIARDPDDPTQYFRQTTNGKDFERVYYIPLQSPIYGATNTTARMMGSHFSDNLTSALVNPSEREEKIENILRM